GFADWPTWGSGTRLPRGGHRIPHRVQAPSASPTRPIATRYGHFRVRAHGDLETPQPDGSRLGAAPIEGRAQGAGREIGLDESDQRHEKRADSVELPPPGLHGTSSFVPMRWPGRIKVPPN